ncbi:hypothetical protein QCM77_36205 [Bradyrhizobium sp. SSUT18]|uniref:hypothetical protein n=1 Tax=Bradyrhizobium sp. SSUT18 TaxID=3040602 RepID=UPI002447C289|nr:hypothetical protein [Bradyrhizobium sp. SSUT18]MDH2405298.1 hypothetical protein [Bradyrhizobium sp. SSUT18]
MTRTALAVEYKVEYKKDNSSSNPGLRHVPENRSVLAQITVASERPASFPLHNGLQAVVTRLMPRNS